MREIHTNECDHLWLEGEGLFALSKIEKVERDGNKVLKTRPDRGMVLRPFECSLCHDLKFKLIRRSEI